MTEHNASPTIETERLSLRHWREADRAPFAQMCADPRVMEFLTPLPSRAESDPYIDRQIAHHREHGFGFWVMEVKASGAFAGFTGLRRVGFEAHFTPAIEVAWRMPVAFWGQGLASEAARACLAFGFASLRLPEIVAITTPGNVRSQAVMIRLGMTTDPAEDFIYPGLPEDDPLQPCVLYRIAAADWRGSNAERP